MLRNVGRMAISTITVLCVFSGSVSAAVITASDKGSYSPYVDNSTFVGLGSTAGDWLTNWRGNSAATKIATSDDFGSSFSAQGVGTASRLFTQSLTQSDKLTVDFDPARNTYWGLAEGSTSSTSLVGGMRLMTSSTGNNLILRDVSGDRVIGTYVDGGLRCQFDLITPGDFVLRVTNRLTGSTITQTGSLGAYPNTFEFGANSAPAGTVGYVNNIGVNVPEPTSAAVLGMSALGLLARRRRRQ